MHGGGTSRWPDLRSGVPTMALFITSHLLPTPPTKACCQHQPCPFLNLDPCQPFHSAMTNLPKSAHMDKFLCEWVAESKIWVQQLPAMVVAPRAWLPLEMPRVYWCLLAYHPPLHPGIGLKISTLFLTGFLVLSGSAGFKYKHRPGTKN